MNLDIKSIVKESIREAFYTKKDVIAYHGTNKNYEDAPLRQLQPEAHILPFGIHFTESEELAKKYGGRVIKANLTFHKLYDATLDKPDWLALEIAGHRYREGMNTLDCISAARPPSSAEIFFRKYQYDGIKYKDPKNDIINYVVINRNNIKPIGLNEVSSTKEGLVESDVPDRLGKWWMRPNLSFFTAYRGGLLDHDTAAKIELGDLDGPENRWIASYDKLFKKGYVRIVSERDRIYISYSFISNSQVKKLKDICIEEKKFLMRDTDKGERMIYDPSLNESLLFLENSGRELDRWIENKQIICESMNVYVEGASYSNLQDLHKVCSQLTDVVLSVIFSKMPQDQKDYFKKNGTGYYETIVPDGSFYVGSGGGLGIINVYASGFTTNTFRQVLKNIFYYLRKWNIKWKGIKIEDSKMYRSKVVRIPVIQNKNKKQGPPELNMSNINAYQIFHNILQYEGESQFKMEAKELIERIETLAHDQGWIDKNVIKPMDSDWPAAEREDNTNIENPHMDIVKQLGLGGARNILGGLDSDDIKTRLKWILEIAKWAVDNGHKELFVA